MSEVQEQVSNPFAGMVHGTRTAPSAPLAEAPSTVVDDEEVVEDTPDVVVDISEEATEEVKAEEPKEEVVADDVVTLDFGQKVEPQEVTTETIDAYKERLSTLEAELAKAKETPKLDPRIEKLNDIIRNGGDINQSVWEMQSKDYSNISLQEVENTLSIVKDKLKYLDGDDADMVNIYLDDKYPTLRGKKDADDFDTDEEFGAQKKREETLLRKEAKEFVPKLKDFQEGMRLPNAPQHKQQEEYEQAVRAYRTEAITKVSEINSFDVHLTDDLTVRIPITGDAAKYADSIATEPENQAQYFNRYRNEDGSVNFQKLKVETYRSQNQEQIDKALFDQGRSYGKKEAIQELQGDNGGITRKVAPTTKKTNSPFSGMKHSKRN
jgi:hypothetical protein